MIPKVIHYCWFGGNPLPEMAQKCIASWKKHCPDYEIQEWNESNYSIGSCDYVKEAYEAAKWAFVSDYARLDIIYHNGGIYFDTDVEVIEPLDDLLACECFIAMETTGYINTGLGFGAERNNKCVGMMLDEYSGAHFRLDADFYDLLPCPRRNTRPFIQYGFVGTKKEVQALNGALIYPPDYFCPMDYRTKQISITHHTRTIHHYSATWITDGEKQMMTDVAAYRKSHGVLSTWLYKNVQEYKMRFPDGGGRKLLSFIRYKIMSIVLNFRR